MIYSCHDLPLNQSWISESALQVAKTLQTAGFDGYLVGGCVRDLLLNRHPKDFDITTNANPDQIKRLFRRARIIGKRFKIVHVRFGREVIEVATYRAKPDSRRNGFAQSSGAGRGLSDSGRVLNDNVFGTIDQDSVRRDFTINALYYDPNREEVTDFLGGVKDIRKKVLRMIGNANERFTEDPVRMLRAARFQAKLGFTLEDGLAPAIANCIELLEDVPAARLFDETLKLFHYGHAVASWVELRKHHLAEKLFPLTMQSIAEQTRAGSNTAEDLIKLALENTDQRIREEKPVIPAFLFAVLLWRPFISEISRKREQKKPFNEALWKSGESVFAKQWHHIAVPRRVSEIVIHIWVMQFELQKPSPKTVQLFLEARWFRAAYDLLSLRHRIGEVDENLVKWWTEIQFCNDKRHQQLISNLPVNTSKIRNQ